MSKNKKQGISYFRLDTKLAEKLSKRIARAGFTSRSDFFTAVSYVALYGVESLERSQKEEELAYVDKLPKSVTTWLRETVPPISEEEIQSGLHQVISEMLFAVIAMKGVELAYENTWGDVRAVFHERFGVWVTESDIREAYISFAAVHKAELANYREQQLRNDD